MKTVIMAGGKGTRIASVNALVPKPMIEVAGKPVLLWQIECLKRQGLNDFIFVTGHLGDVVENYFGDGSAFGIKIEYYREKEPLGTAGALYFLQDRLSEDFLLLNGDIIFDADISRLAAAHKENKKKGAYRFARYALSHTYSGSLWSIVARSSRTILNMASSSFGEQSANNSSNWL